MLLRLGLGCLLSLVLFIGTAAAPPSAEIAYFASGGIIRISGHQIEEDKIILSLRNGGEVICDPKLIDRIELDETPIPMLSKSLKGKRQWSRERLPLPAKPYARLIQNAAQRHGIDAKLLHALIEVESSYRTDARSPRGAMGLMQLTAETAERYGVSDPYDPNANIEGGARHLRWLLDRFGIVDALAAYNAGEGSVRRYRGIPPYPETRRYVTRILDLLDS